jgi:hypothetical protein
MSTNMIKQYTALRQLFYPVDEIECVNMHFLFAGIDGTGLEINNEIDIRRFDNTEIAMSLTTDIKSGDHFFTDLNGFQMIRRKKMNKLPLQGNYYPIPSMAYIQVSFVGQCILKNN